MCMIKTPFVVESKMPSTLNSVADTAVKLCDPSWFRDMAAPPQPSVCTLAGAGAVGEADRGHGWKGPGHPALRFSGTAAHGTGLGAGSSRQGWRPGVLLGASGDLQVLRSPEGGRRPSCGTGPCWPLQCCFWGLGALPGENLHGGPFCVSGSYAHALDGLYRVAREGEEPCVAGAGAAPSSAPESPEEAEGARGIVQDLGGGPMDLGGRPTCPLPPAEGLRKLFSGATMASSRGMLVTVGQVGLLPRWGSQRSIRGPWPHPAPRGRRGSRGHRAQVGTGGSVVGPGEGRPSRGLACPCSHSASKGTVEQVCGRPGQCPCGPLSASPGMGLSFWP